MKKIISLLVMALACVIGTTNVKAITLTGHEILIDGNHAYKHYESNGYKIAGDDSWFLTVDEVPAYCIDFGTEFFTSIVSEAKGELREFVPSDEVYNRLNLIYHYGYSYNGHNNNKYYLASQYLVWKTLSDAGVWPQYDLNTLGFYTSRSYYQAGTKVDLSSEISEIETLIKNHYITPSFCKNTYTLTEGEELTLTDENNALSSFNLTTNNNDNISFNVNGNKITIKGLKESSNNIITLEKTGDSSASYVYQYLNQQKLFVGKNIPSVSCEIKINVEKKAETPVPEEPKEPEVKYGMIKIIKVEKDNTIVKLKDVVFEVYDENNNLVDTLITDENGEATIKLVIGKYTIKETMTNASYILDDKPVTIELKEDEIKTMTFENEKEEEKIVTVKTGDFDIYIIWIAGALAVFLAFKLMKKGLI